MNISINNTDIPLSENKHFSSEIELNAYEMDIWIEALRAPQNYQFTVALSIRLPGDINFSRLNDAIQQVLNTEPAYHKVFLDSGERPRFRMVTHEVWDESYEFGNEEEADVFFDKWSCKVWDLFASPLLNVAIGKLGNATVLMLRTHHIIADSWALNLLTQKIMAAYANKAEILNKQEKDISHSAVKPQLMQRAELEQMTRDVVAKIGHVEPALFPKTEERSPTSYQYRRVFKISESEVKTGIENGFSPFLVVSTALAVLLSNVYGSEQFFIGVPFLNRNETDISIINHRANTLPVKIEVESHKTFREIGTGIKQFVAFLKENESVPLGRVISALGRTGSSRQLFDATVSYIRYPERQEISGVTDTFCNIAHVHAQDAIAIHLHTYSDNTEVLGEICLNSASFDSESSAQIFLDTLVQLVGDVVAYPDKLVRSVNLLTSAQTETLQRYENGPVTQYSFDDTVMSLFMSKAAQFPENIALRSFDGDVFSYSQLDGWSSAIAVALEERGIKPGDIVAISMARSPAMLAAIFAVLKAGAAYLPIDSDYPEDRIQYMLEDSQVKLVVSNLPHVIKAEDPRWFDVDAIPTESSSHSGYKNKARPNDPAYVIYTSGSTGRPKGVIIEHHSVVNRLEWMQEILPLDSTDVILQKTPISFDVSVWELFWWAMTGASVALLKQGAQRDPREIIQAISTHGVTVAHFVPSMLEPYVQTLNNDRHYLSLIGSLKCLFTSGEALTPSVVNKYRKLFSRGMSPPKLINLYGPTEATVDVTYYEVNLTQEPDIGSIPIGFPINNTSVRIVSLHGVRQPVGIPGELQISGVQLARGYLNRNELTAERFIIDPNDNDNRWYRTGDLVVWTEDGAIFYLGRMDDQVKIRGNRVELGEIKNVLLTQPELLNAEVVVVDDESRGKHLVAVYVSRQVLNENELRQALAARLPSFMIPARFIRLENIPLTPNGKFNRASVLTDLNNTNVPLSIDRLTATERLVAKVWGKILTRQGINRNDDFYALGGDSLLMLKVRSELEKLGYQVTLSDLGEHTTVYSLGHFLDKVSDTFDKPKEALPPFALVSDIVRKRVSDIYEDAYPVSQLQLGLLFHSREEEGARTYKDVFRYTLKSAWNEVAFKRALQSMIQRHPALRTTFNISDYDSPLQLIKSTVLFDEVLSIATPKLAEYERMIAHHMDQWSQFDYSFVKGPLFHIAVFINNGSGVIDLVLSFHHAILDGGSVANLIRELLLSYFEGGESNNLGYPVGDLPNPSLFIQDEINTLANQDHHHYWKVYLDGAVNTLPIGLAGHANSSAKTIFAYRFFVNSVLDMALNQLSISAQIPVRCFYLAAHCLAIASMSGTKQVLTGVVTHVRPEIQHSENLLGLFLNTLPLRVGIEGFTWLQLVEFIYLNEKKSYKHRRFPLSKIQSENRGLSIRTAFNYIYFHMLQDVAGKTDIELLSFEPKEETNFAILTNVMRDFTGKRTSVRVDMDGCIYAKEQADIFSRLFISALESIVYHSSAPVTLNRPLEELGYITASIPAPAFNSLSDSMSKVVLRSPTAIAITYDDREWNYSQLWDATTRIAILLTEQGVSQQDVVGVALPRSFVQIATVVAIFRLGAICLPIDLSYPANRISLILSIAEPTVVVVNNLVTTLPDEVQCLVLGDDELESVTGQIDEVVIESNDIAYILFTSGSTGIPKGVTMPHRGLVNLVNWQNKTSSGNRITSTLQFAPLSFDVSFQEIFSTFLSGAVLHLIGEDERRDPTTLLRHIDRKGVERIFMPYIALQQLAEAAFTLGIFPQKLRIVISSGEQLRVTQEIRTLMENLPGSLLENQYGPTETHVVTSYSMVGDPEQFPALPPIGKPITSVGILILDDALNIVPDGVPGEICVFGEALASGYYRSSAETRNKFIPQAGVPGRVLYRTGDSGIRAISGEIVSLGRNDTQVKVRGYRIELSEIELKILRFFENRGEHIEVAVIARPRDEFDAYLIAYLSGKEKVGNKIQDELRQFLVAELPGYMVPTHITWINTFPKTPSGKRDDANLRQREVELETSQYFRAPKDEHEKRLCELVAELLRINDISPEQNIFDCGATSLTAMRIVVLVEKLYGINVPLSAFVSAPTIAQLARLIQEGGGQLNFEPLVPLRGTGCRRPIFLVHPMGGNILSYLRMLPYLPSDQPFYALQASGVDVGSLPIATIEEQAHFYIDAIKRIQPTGPYVIGGWSYGGFVAFEMAAQLIQAGESLSNVLILDTMALSSQAKGRAGDDSLLNWFFWELLWTSRGSALPVQIVPSHIESLQKKFEYITDHAIAIGAIPAGSTKAIMRRLFEVYRTHWQAATEYNYDALYPKIDITLIRAKQPLPQILRDMHDAIRSEYKDPFNGWRNKTTGRITLVEVDGDHLTIMEEPYVESLVSVILHEIKSTERD